MSSDIARMRVRGSPPAERVASAKADKMDARRIELAEATLETLAELGYARTSLREIAQNSEFSHGVLHYYFRDKVDLICCGVRQYKNKRVTTYDEILETIKTRDALLDAFCAKVIETLTTEPKLHRLWYDLKAQALFDSAFRNEVQEIHTSLEASMWRVATRFAELGNKQVALSSMALYTLFDGLFQNHLMKHLAGDEDAAALLEGEIRHCLPLLA